MADVITRLKLESSEYDSKIKRATQGLLQMEQECRKVGGTLAVLEKDQLEFVKGLGQMETVSKSARGKLSELTQAYTELSMQYKRLTDEEKKGDFGKALSSSLDQLKGRINDTKQQLADVDKELGNTGKESDALGGIVDKLAGKFGISTSALGVWGAALAAGTVALDVAKDAFFASEQNIDDWNRTVYSAQSTYQAFLTALNTGDVSGFLNNINTIVSAASEAYNALDRLGTMQSIQSPQVAKKQSEIQRMETMLRTGRYIAPVDGRSTGGMKTGDVLTAEQKQNIAKNLSSAINEVAGLTKNEVKASTDAINALYKEQAVRLGMSNKQFQEGTASMAAFEKNLEKARKYQEFEAQHTSSKTYTTSAGTSYTVTDRDNAVNPYAAYKNWGVFKDDGDLYQKIIQLIQQRSSQESQYYGNVGRAYRGINRAEGISLSGGGGSNSGKNTPSWSPIAMGDMAGIDISTLGRSRADVKTDLSAAQKEYENAGDVFGRIAAKILIEQLKSELGTMEAQEDPFADANNYDFQKDIGRWEKEQKGEEDKDKEKGDKKEVNLAKEIGNMAGGMDQVVGGLEQLGVDIPDGLKDVVQGIQVVTTILTGIASIATAIAAIATADALIPFARGGIVGKAAGGMMIPGNSFSGDNLRLPVAGGGMIGVNAGELILNRAQQGNLAAQLSTPSGSAMGGQPYVSGENIYLGVNNYSRRSGRGELVTTEMLKNRGIW